MTRSWRIPLFVTVGLVAIVVPAAVRFYTDWLWFSETGYQGVFVRTLVAEGTLGGAAMAVAFGVLLLNFRIAVRALSRRELVFATREGPRFLEDMKRSPDDPRVRTVNAMLRGPTRLSPRDARTDVDHEAGPHDVRDAESPARDITQDR